MLAAACLTVLVVSLTLSGIRTAHALNGSPAGLCQFSNTLFLTIPWTDEWAEGAPASRGLCSAIYLGNRVVVTAAHCTRHAAQGLTPDEQIHVWIGHDNGYLDDPDGDGFYTWFPNASGALGFPVTCTTHPNGEWVTEDGGVATRWVDATHYEGTDIAVCTLPELSWDIDPFEDHPPYTFPRPNIPALVPNGCEDEQVRQDLFCGGISPIDAIYAGQGNATPGDLHYFDDGEIGEQRYLNWVDNTVLVARNHTPRVVRPGDSGGPLIYQMHDGTYRVLGVASHITQLSFPGEEGSIEVAIYEPIPQHLRWIETQSGLDVTPCHDWSSGGWEWNHDAFCAETYERNPASSTGTLATDCFDGLEGGIGDGCAGWDEARDGCSEGFAPPPPVDEREFFRVTLVDAGAPQGPLRELARESLFGTDARDEIVARGPSWVYAGSGDDLVTGSEGSDRIEGRSGDDTFSGGGGDDILVGGRGADRIDGGAGDDIVVVVGACELGRGEELRGGAGYDILYSPMSVSELWSGFGVRASGFEEVRLVHAAAQRARCSSDGSVQTLDLVDGSLAAGR